ncbi:hypothetical protein CDV55_104874 [Aspergillus turcosus]|nr:hypothetical protein CDV55_104874 [Aspergillus turcosus]
MHSTSTSEGTSSGQSPLQMHIEELSSFPLHNTIQSLAQLLPELTTSVTATGVRLVTHPSYEGTGKLDDLGRLYLRAQDRCTREHASFRTRLLHVSLDSMIGALYAASQAQLVEGLADGSVELESRLCDDEPSVVILRGGRYALGETWIRASREQVEHAMPSEGATMAYFRLCSGLQVS